MRRVVLPMVSGLVLAGCVVAAGAGAARPGPVAALILSMIVAAGGVALRKRPAA